MTDAASAPALDAPPPRESAAPARPRATALPAVAAACPCCAAVPVIRDPVVSDAGDFAPVVHGTRWPTLRDVVLAWRDWTGLQGLAQEAAPQRSELTAAGVRVGGHVAKSASRPVGEESAS